MAESSRARLDSGVLLKSLRGLRKGDFSVRMPTDQTGIAGEIAEAFNGTAELLPLRSPFKSGPARGGMEYVEFTTRVRQSIAANQGLDVENISLSKAAKDIDVPETTLRSTLDGHFPRSEEYWRKLRNYCQGSLDWLICGQGEGPGQERSRGYILVIEDDLDRLGLIRLQAISKIN